MRVRITARHCDVPTDVLERTEELAGSFTKFEPRATAVDVVYVEEKHGKSVEMIVHIDGADEVVAHADASDFRPALDQVVDRMKRILRKGRERRRDHKAPKLSEAAGPE